MEKVWMRGVPGRGDEVTDMLKTFGGEVSAHSSQHSEDPRFICFINHAGNIDSVHESFELAKVIMDCYQPVGLPASKGPFWENGSILIRKDAPSNSGDKRGDAFAIVNANEKIVPFFKAYAELTADNIINDNILLPFKKYRLATPEEIKEFVNRIMEMGKWWNPWSRKIENW